MPTRTKRRTPANKPRQPLLFPAGMTSTTTPAGVLVHDREAIAIGRSSKRRRKLFATRRDKEGWWLYAEPICPDVPWWGPWVTKAEAIEAGRSWRRNAACNLPRRQVTSDRKPMATKSTKRTKAK